MFLPYVSDAEAFAGAALSCAVALAWLGGAAVLHRRHLCAVPVRVHVAGSRGKTATTRLIAAGLREGGRRVVAKTTGTEPRLILRDGSERAWRRSGPPNIGEQSRFFRAAVRHGADAVVLESMAIEPEYLWASERYFVRATHVAITNVRPDHAEVLGDDPGAAAAATSLVVPHGGHLFLTGEAAVEPVLGRAAAHACDVHVVQTDDLPIAESNRRLAIAVCAALGVPQAVAERGMAEAGVDPGAFSVTETEVGGKPIRFANAFSCNDPESLRRLWLQHQPQATAVVVFNARRDRPLRTRALLKALAAFQPPVRLFLAGGVPKRWAVSAGFTPENVARLGTRGGQSAIAELAAASDPGATVWGVGNYSGLGARIVAALPREACRC